jgi:hypothetical protein
LLRSTTAGLISTLYLGIFSEFHDRAPVSAFANSEGFRFLHVTSFGREAFGFPIFRDL